MTVDEFYTAARIALKVNPGWRYGQALFNTLLDVRPDLAERVRTTPNDPFYAYGMSGDERLYRFGEFINSNWGPSE